MAVTEEADQKAEIQDTKIVAERHGPQFIPKLRGKKLIIRLVSGGLPITGTLEGYNPYEILIHTAKGQLLVFKHAIAMIEIVDEPKGYKADI
jgi:sRNA-binding regulator protein Hfq